MNEKDILDPLSILILQILYLANICNYQGGALTEADLYILANYIVNNDINIVEITTKSEDDISVGINFFSVALNRN